MNFLEGFVDVVTANLKMCKLKCKFLTTQFQKEKFVIGEKQHH